MFSAILSSILPLLVLLNTVSSSSGRQQKIADIPASPKVAAAMKMLPPQKLPAGRKMLETDYFKPKEYNTREFESLVTGLSQEIRRDLNQVVQTYSLIANYARAMKHLEKRVDRMERSEAEELGEEQPVAANNKFLLPLCLFIMLALALLLLANFFLLKRLVRSTPGGGIKHVRLTNTTCCEP